MYGCMRTQQKELSFAAVLNLSAKTDCNVRSAVLLGEVPHAAHMCVSDHITPKQAFL